jgi:polysaccharide deacetylase family protein (PEP-CTERM system associated)
MHSARQEITEIREPGGVSRPRTSSVSSDSWSLERRHLLTVAVEEYFHATALRRLTEGTHERRLETRLDRNLDHALELLDEYNTRATFFVLGSITRTHPDAVRRLADAGHEIAARGWEHQGIDAFDAESFRDDVRRSKAAIEDLIGRPVVGYRIPEGRFRPSAYWALAVLAGEGFTYDSSMYPRFRELASEPWRRFPHKHVDGPHTIIEYPLSSWGPDSFLLPIAGGNYIRQLPKAVVKMAIADWAARHESPFNMYFNIWELDGELPRLTLGSWTTRLRIYRNLDRVNYVLRYFLERYRFESIAGNLARLRSDLQPESLESREAAIVIPIRPGIVVDDRSPVPAAAQVATEPFTIVIPCYNEEASLPYLRRALDEVVSSLAPRSVSFVFVDDSSTDDSLTLLHELFGGRSDCQIIAHERNRGVAAAIMTGIRAAETELVGTVDCDCTYDPLLFADMLPMLDEDAVMVTGSPYHPDGTVRRVPPWRLFLSRTLSGMYRRLLHNKLYTYTSCFRVYRRSAVHDIVLQSTGFLGIAEMVAEIDRRGGRIREFPAVLDSRILGVSKMRTLRVIRQHLRLLRSLLRERLLGPPHPNAREHRARLH